MSATPRILIAGIGNIFQGDDAFGVEVIQRMLVRPLPDGVTVRDFGIRGFDLAYALNEPWEMAILVDALSRNQTPGTVFVLEPDRNDLEAGTTETIQPHGLHPVQALRVASSMGDLPRRILVVGCEPAELGGEEGVMGLSPAVQAAIESAVNTIEKLITETAALPAS